MKKRGRPTGSKIRQNIIEILAVIGEGYGYQISREYNKIFPGCSMRSIHYHLKKGLQTKEFKVARVAREEGWYSWGPATHKTYYALGENADPKIDARVARHFEEKE